MSEKEKAIELVEKYLELLHYSNNIYNRAKIMALICVDEILNLLWHTHKNEKEYRYYEQVKEQIKLL